MNVWERVRVLLCADRGCAADTISVSIQVQILHLRVRVAEQLFNGDGLGGGRGRAGTCVNVDDLPG